MKSADSIRAINKATASGRRVRLILFVVVCLSALFALIYFVVAPTESLRYRLTYEVEVNGEIHTGTGVVELLVQNSETNYGVVLDKVGEAIPIDLGNGKYLFSLLETAPPMSPGSFITRAFGKRFHTLKKNKPSMQLPFHLLPALVTFGNIKDPVTIRIVDPNDLTPQFGIGAKIVRVTLEITDHAVTVGRIRNLLPWLRSWKGIRRANRNFHEYDFIT